MLTSPRSRIIRLLALGVLVSLLAAAPAVAQGAYEDLPGIPEGPIGDHIKGLLKVFDSDDPEVAWAFIEAHFTPAFQADPTTPWPSFATG
jgi:hypothetical protein